MAYDENLAAGVRAALAEQEGLVERKMFGGVGFMLRGNMCCGIQKSDLILRLGSDKSVEALHDPRMRPFDTTGRPMKGWAVINADALEDETELSLWVQKSADFALTLPPK